MLPEIEHVFHVLQRMQQEVVTPFLPVDGHGAITVYAGGWENQCLRPGAGGREVPVGCGVDRAPLRRELTILRWGRQAWRGGPDSKAQLLSSWGWVWGPEAAEGRGDPETGVPLDSGASYSPVQNSLCLLQGDGNAQSPETLLDLGDINVT